MTLSDAIELVKLHYSWHLDDSDVADNYGDYDVFNIPQTKYYLALVEFANAPLFSVTFFQSKYQFTMLDDLINGFTFTVSTLTELHELLTMSRKFNQNMCFLKN